MLRSDLLREADTFPEYVSPLAADAPELGEAAQRTMLRSMPKRQTPVLPAAAETEAAAAKPSTWLTRKNVLLGSAGLVLVAALSVGAAWISAGDPAETGATAAASDSLQVSQQDSPLPTGLWVSRTVSFDPQTEQISLEITYSAQKAPLTGALLEIVPSTGSGSPCPAVSWEGATATKHQASSTGLSASCGWKLEGVQVPANGRASISASFPGTVADAAELTEWLGGAAAAIAGGEDGIRFSDGCSGAVAISSDGLVATSRAVTSECRLYAAVGNFTNLQSSPFSITTRE